MARLNHTRSIGAEKVDAIALQEAFGDEGAKIEPRNNGGTLEVSDKGTPADVQNANWEQAIYQPHSGYQLLFCTADLMRGSGGHIPIRA
jgi:hypothetical protein